MTVTAPHLYSIAGASLAQTRARESAAETMLDMTLRLAALEAEWAAALSPLCESGAGIDDQLASMRVDGRRRVGAALEALVDATRALESRFAASSV